MENKRIMLVGGGSGGHVYPLLAVADALQNSEPSVELLIVGDGEFIERAASTRSIPFRKIKAAKFRSYFDVRNFTDLWKVPVSFFQCLWIMYWFMPDAVFSKGAYSSLMPVIAAKLYFIPVYLHDSDAIPGRANRLLSKMAKNVFTSFRDASKYFKPEKVIFSGNPIRKNIASASRVDGKTKLGLDPQRPVILAIGASQGARSINTALIEASPLLAEKWQVLHQTGETQFENVKKDLEAVIEEGKGDYGDKISQFYKLYPFFGEEDLSAAYAAADVLIIRAGSAMIFEAAAIGKPTIVIPITKSANNHQVANAREISRYGAVMIEEDNLTRNILVNQIEELLKPEKSAAVSEKIKEFSTPNAAQIISDTVLSSIVT